MRWVLSKETDLGVKYEVFKLQKDAVGVKTYIELNGISVIYESAGRLNQKPLVPTNVEILSLYEGHLFAQTKCTKPEKYMMMYSDCLYTLEAKPQLVFEDEAFANARVYKI